MHALYHGRCIQKWYQTTHQLKYIYIYIYIYNWVWPRGITIPSPYLCTILNALCIDIRKISKIFKKMWVFCPHSIFMLPSCILKTIPGPLDLYKPYGSILELYDFPVQNVYQIHLKSASLLHLNQIPINNMISIRYISIEKWYIVREIFASPYAIL